MPEVQATIVIGYIGRMALRIRLLMTLSVLPLNGCRRATKVSNVVELQDGVRSQPLAERGGAG